MKRIVAEERKDWKAKAESLGFIFHTMYGEPYWDESVYYEFSMDQIENDIEDPSEEIHQMSLDVVDRVVTSEEYLTKLQIPEYYWQAIGESWIRRDPSLYGRFDLSYNGKKPAKMLEYNADTPTSLYETAFFQWLWLEDKINDGSFDDQTDQFNSLQDQIIERFEQLFEKGSHIHFSSAEGVTEDRQTVKYLEDCAAQAGMLPYYVDIEKIGIDRFGRFADEQSNIIQSMFKLYPWEEMMREDYGKYTCTHDMTWLEPMWKAILSNKAFLPLIWKFNKGHPNLLPAYFDGEEDADELGPTWVRKPIFSREGANVTIFENGKEKEFAKGEYGEEGYIIQQYHQLPKFEGNYTVIGSWIVGDTPAGMAIREDKSPITKDLSRFIPHVIKG